MPTPRQNPLNPSRRSVGVVGLTPAELGVVVAVMACERAEGGYPCRRAIWDVARGGEERLPSQLVTRGWLERAGTVGRVALYRATERAWLELGFPMPVRRAENATAAE